MGRPARHPRCARGAAPDALRPGPHLTRSASPGAVPSPNIWRHPEVYELENRAADPDGRLWDVLRDLASWEGRRLLDVGCGSGFHLPLFAAEAAAVVGVEPHPGLAGLARRRTRTLPHVEVREGTVQRLPVPDHSVDVVTARWAYFFGPGCEPGLAEVTRVLRRGGVVAIVDNDASRSTFGGWFRRGFPHLPAPDVVERFWARQGFTRTPVDMGWRFARRTDLEAVVRIELPAAAAEEALAHHVGAEVDYAVNVWSRTV